MKIRIVIIISTILFPFASIAGESAKKDAAYPLQVLKISAQDARAVVKTSEGKTVVIKPGTDLGAAGKVVEIAADRVVLEEKSGVEVEKVIIRLKDGKQSVERMTKIEPKRPVLYAPAAREMNK
jgi:ribosomal protein L24